MVHICCGCTAALTRVGWRGGLWWDDFFFFLPKQPARRDKQHYSQFLSRSSSSTGSSVSISHSLSSSPQRQLNLNQSNYQLQNRPQTQIPVHRCPLNLPDPLSQGIGCLIVKIQKKINMDKCMAVRLLKKKIHQN